MKISKDWVIAWLFKLFILINLFCPMVTYSIDMYNTEVVIANLVVILILLTAYICNRVNKISKDIYWIYLLFSLGVLAYSCVAIWYIGINHNLWWNCINRISSFGFFLFLLKRVDYNWLVKHNIINFLIYSFIFSIILSIVFYVLGGNLINFANGTIIINRQDYNAYFESRLTWIFGHKSAYGLMLILFQSLVLYHRKTISKKLQIIVAIVTSIAVLLTSSAIAYMGLIFIWGGLFADMLLGRKTKLWKKITGLIMIALSGIVGLFALNYISEVRDIGSIGGRTDIWKAGIYTITNQYLPGVGNRFFNINFYTNGRTINNFHNVFLNEMLHYSFFCGILFFILIAFLLFYCLVNKKQWLTIMTALSVIIILNLDYSLRDSFFAFFIFILFLFNVKKRCISI